MERVRAGLRIPYDLNTWLIREAQKQGIAKNALILQILWEWTRREGQEAPRDFADKEAVGGR